jgi:hypothetical protein
MFIETPLWLERFQPGTSCFFQTVDGAQPSWQSAAPMTTSRPVMLKELGQFEKKLNCLQGMICRKKRGEQLHVFIGNAPMK